MSFQVLDMLTNRINELKAKIETNEERKLQIINEIDALNKEFARLETDNIDADIHIDGMRDAHQVVLSHMGIKTGVGQ